MAFGKINQPRQTEKTVNVLLMNWWVVYSKKWKRMKGIFARAIEDEILSKPLKQRFKFRVEVNGINRKEASYTKV